jgi:hypothetical protein
MPTQPKTLLALTVLALALTGCNLAGPATATVVFLTDTPAAFATAPLPTQGVAPTNTFPPPLVLPTFTPVTPQPSMVAATPVPTTASNSGSGSGGNSPTYLDDRSTPQELMRSFANSISRHEYVRTYSYWEQGAAGLPSYAQFAQGYADTQSAQVTVGNVASGGAAGSIYYSVPVTLVATLTNNTTQTFVGCYTLRQPQAQNFGAPPFGGMVINSAQVQQVANNANTASLMASACTGTGGLPGVADVTSPQSDISTNAYIDDRTDGAQVLRSLFNAVNRKEYVRAYSYWQPGAAQLQPYDQFQQGYADTDTVQLTVGSQTSEGAAGQLYYNVPVILVSQGTSGTQTFTGCYVLQLSNPGIQGQPPFQPLAIRSASVQQVPNSPAPTMPACP